MLTGVPRIVAVQLTTLENNLNNLSLNASVIEGSVISTFSGFNPSIAVAPGDVNVCLWSVCS
jgi:hypothetical protein